ncbi:MAG: hypothetical protein JOZ04_01835 [Acidimicrobiia bacterium]|nr:hypothetical protein [Acidimicrobiia bacterium]
MKCSVCAQDIPEDRYSEHLESEHGVTDDPTAVLIQHLTGLGSTAGEGEGDDELPDEEPSDADAFEQFLAAHPVPGSDEEEVEEPDSDEEAEEPDADEEPAAAEAEEEQGEPEEEPESAEAGVEPETEPEAEEEDEGGTDEDEDGSDELTDEDEAEFERMLAASPEDGDDETEAPGAVAAVGAAAVGAAAVGAAAADTEPEVQRPGRTGGAAAPSDDKTFAVWDEARGAAATGAATTATATAADEDLLVVAPSKEEEAARRRRQAAFVGLGAVVILIAIAVIYLLTRDTTTKNTAATAPITTPLTTVAPTFLPGPPNGATTTIAPTPTTPTTAATTATTAAPAVPATPATTAPPDPASRIVFRYTGAQCTPSGALTIYGSVTNTNAATYSIQYTVTMVRTDGTQQGTANGSVSHLGPGATFNAPPPTTGIAQGTCTYPLQSGPNPRQTITSITPG